MEVLVEPSQPESPRLVLHRPLAGGDRRRGQQGPQADDRLGSEDRTLRGWDADGWPEQLWQLHAPRPRCAAVACTPANGRAATSPWPAAPTARPACSTSTTSRSCPRDLAERHQGRRHLRGLQPRRRDLRHRRRGPRHLPVGDGRPASCSSRLSQAHRGPVTSLQFAANGQLVSAGRDNALALWNVAQASTLAPRPPSSTAAPATWPSSASARTASTCCSTRARSCGCCRWRTGRSRACCKTRRLDATSRRWRCSRRTARRS